MTEFTMDDAVRTIILAAGLGIAFHGIIKESDQTKTNPVQKEFTKEYVQKQDSIINYQTQNQR
jgi:hypothetical protein